MGIRFLCDACGKKLNIKEELAGKKGRCPKCNAVIKIPAESTLESGSKKAEADSAGTQASGRTDVAEKTIQEDSPPPVPDSPTQAPAGSSPREKKKSKSKSAATVKPDKSPVATEPAADVPPEPELHQPSPPTPPELTPPEPESVRDAFAENPNGRWFVRPVSGGQFGPAESDVMKTWLKEGRVGRDSLVWCEGWEEWQNADEVFAEELGADSVSREKNLIEDPKTNESAPQPANRVMYHQAARKKAKTMGVVLVVGLLLVSIALAVVLVIVVNNANSKNKNKKESANLSFTVDKNHNLPSGFSRISAQAFRDA